MDYVPWVLWVSRVVFSGARAASKSLSLLGEFAWLLLIAD